MGELWTSHPQSGVYLPTTHVYGWDRSRRKNTTHHFSGMLLVFSTTKVDEHSDIAHLGGARIPMARCSACRWTELALYRQDEQGENAAGWVLHSIGRSVVPGETDRPWFRVVTDPREVVSAMLQRDSSTGQKHIPSYAKRALDEASDLDDNLADVVDTFVLHDS